MPHLGVINLRCLTTASIIIVLCFKGCKSKTQGCVNPPGIDDGVISSLKHRYERNEEITYECFPDYLLVGPTSRKCLGNDIWSGTAPECVLNLCGIPGTPLNGFNDYNASQPSNQTTYGCNVGYALVGEKSRSCSIASRLWQPSEMPKCVINRAYKGTVSQSVRLTPGIHPWVNGNLSDVYNLTDGKNIVTWSLDLKRPTFVTDIKLYLSKGSRASLDVLQSNTSADVRSATRIYRVEILHSTSPSQRTDRYWARFFIIESSSPVSASEIEIFDNSEKPTCGKPDEPPHSTKKMRDTLTYEYSCLPNYVLQISPSVVTCRDGQWTGNLPKCIIKSTSTSTSTTTTTTTTTKPVIPITIKTTSMPATPSTPADSNITGYVGIMGFIMGGVAALLAIIIIIIVIVCIMKKYYKPAPPVPHPPPSSTYTSPREYIDGSHSSASRSYDGNNSHRGNSLHLYDSIRDTPGIFGSKSPTDFDASDCIYNEGYGTKYSPSLQNRRYEHLRPVPRTPLYDEVREGEEGIPMTSATHHWDSSDPEYNGSRVDSLYISGAPRTTL